MNRPHKPIEETPLFELFEECADWAWQAIKNWNRFAQINLGGQMVRSLDSVGANLSEGDGRFTAAEGLHFFVIARGSAREALVWCRRVQRRGLLPPDEAKVYIGKLESATKQLNLLINYRRNSKEHFVREEVVPWTADTAE